LGILFRIILPLSKPALTVVALFTLLGCWNDYYGPLIYVNNADLMPLALGVQAMRTALSHVGGTHEFAYAYLMAVSTMVTAPIVIAFFLAQRTFIEGISLTGMKG
jgi:ABC-type glycerol-3-phosphate transport system permease component